MNLFLIRYGEIAIKGQNKSFFTKTLKRNIKDKFKKDDENLQINHEAGRLYLRSILPQKKIVDYLVKIPGIVSFSPTKKIESNLDTFLKEGLEAIESKKNINFTSFRITTRRTDKEFPITSMEISQKVGAYILKNNTSLSVDLNTPDFIVYFEVRKEGSFIYTDIIPGIGGLPVGSSGRALLLLSGGIDSPVAGWLSLKRGIFLESLYFHSPPFIGERSKKKVIDLCNNLSNFAPEIKLSIISLTPTLKIIREKIPTNYTITVMRRMMMRMAESLANKEGIPALITGESIGQVASQTLENIRAINQVIDLPVLRPLSGMDKTEITDLARKIGTYRISVRPYEDCCTLFIPKHPILKPSIDELVNIEKSIPVDDLVVEAVQGKETFITKLE